MEIRTIFTAASANRYPSCSDSREEDGLVAFGSGRLVALYNPTDPWERGVRHILTAHKHEVTTLKFSRFSPGWHCFRHPENDNIEKTKVFASGDAGGSVVIWKEVGNLDDKKTPWVPIVSLPLIHAPGSISALGISPIPSSNGNEHLLVTSSSDPIVKVWRINVSEKIVTSQDPFSAEPRSPSITQIQTLSLQNKFALDIALLPLTIAGDFLMAAGCTDGKIQLWTYMSSSKEHSRQLVRSIALPGHSDWIRCLDFVILPSSSSFLGWEVFLSSGSQDGFIRLWKISHDKPNSFQSGQQQTARDQRNSKFQTLQALLDREDEAAVEGGGASASGVEEGEDDAGIRLKSYYWTTFLALPSTSSSKDNYTISEVTLSCTPESVLAGHEGWVTNVHWSRADTQMIHVAAAQATQEGNYSSFSKSSLPPPRLLSSSSDRSMIIWACETDGGGGGGKDSAGVWVALERFGELEMGTNLGFFGALWVSNTTTGVLVEKVLASGWGGSFHIWQKRHKQNKEENAVVAGGWKPAVGISGHFDSAKNVIWEPQGEYFMSVGMDMTTRIWAPWRRPKRWAGENDTKAEDTMLETWHELARPQIHGYPVMDLAFVGSRIQGADSKLSNQRTGRLEFVSASDEKILRAFEAPAKFVEMAEVVGGIAFENEDDETSKMRPRAANVPALGLSNRAATFERASESRSEEEGEEDSRLVEQSAEGPPHPPYEEDLLTITLWPEKEKVWGHSYEMAAVCCTHDGALVASACKATSAEHAVIRLHTPLGWTEIGKPLEGHTLTITNMVFSSDDKWLLAVGRDRSWWIYGKNDEGQYVPKAWNARAHSRIIWRCAWGHGDRFFVTTSRDKTAKIWQISSSSSSEWVCAATLRFQEPATSVACASDGEKHILAIGLETGKLVVFTSQDSICQWTQAGIVDYGLRGVESSLTGMAFSSSNQSRLALCSEEGIIVLVELLTNPRETGQGKKSQTSA